MCTICQNWGALFPSFPRMGTEWNHAFANPEGVYARISSTRQYSVPFKLHLIKTSPSFNKNWITIVKRPKCNKRSLRRRSAACEALEDNLKAQTARNAEQEQPIYLFKQETADLKVNAAKIGKPSRKWIKRLSYSGKSFSSWRTTASTWTMNVEKTILSSINKRILLEMRRPQHNHGEMSFPDSKQTLGVGLQP